MDYKVLVSCMTYNQNMYIEDALNGFAMQQTNFSYVCLVMDDASTDGEQDVIKAFLERECNTDDADCYEIDEANIIIARHKGNHNCTFVVYFLKQNLFGTSQKKQLVDEWRSCCKYEAWCEGDDYWTDPHKLQKQYDVLEANSECTICFNRVQVIRADKSGIEYLIPRSGCAFREGKITLKDLAVEEFKLEHWCFHTSSFFFRRGIGLDFASFKKNHLPSFPYGDMPLQMYALLQGDGFFLGDTMGCYRLLSGGWNTKMATDHEFNRKIVRLVIDGFHEFDEYTKFKYHKYVRLHVLRKEYNNLYDTRPRQLKFLRLNIEYYSKVGKEYIKRKFSDIHGYLKTAFRKSPRDGKLVDND